MDRLRIFLGKRPIVVDNLELFSPTINQIDEVTEPIYHFYLTLASFDKETVFKELFKVTDEEYLEISKMDDYDALTIHETLGNYVATALSFFSKKEIIFNDHQKIFTLNENIVVHKKNYKKVSDYIRKLNGLLKEKEELQFKNDRVKKKYEEFMKRKRKMMKNSGLELKDMLSVLCSAEGNGISIFNVGELTIYQVYEHFERINIMENHKRMLALWANTFSLKEGTKLEDWIVRTNF